MSGDVGEKLVEEEDLLLEGEREGLDSDHIGILEVTVLIHLG
jgi:hypothetical protein